jgi:succinylglutamate desuccinylase
MPQIYSKALDQNLNIERIIGRLAGKDSGGCLIFLAGVHGNEPSGVFALTEVFKKLSKLQKPIRGSVYGIAGNLWALEHGERFHTTDLNRLWTPERISKLESGSFNPQNRDEKEQLEL